MRSAIVLILVTFFASCSCPECDTFPSPLRIILLDNAGNNLLENKIVIDKIETCSSNHISYTVKDYVIPNSKEKTYLEITSWNLGCISEECCAFIHFTDGTTDTVLYRIREEESRCCYSYYTDNFEYNNVNYTGQEENTIGAFEVVLDD